MTKYYKDVNGMKAFGRKLRQVRMEVGYTQERLANECDFPPSQISRIETGTINTSLSHIIKIAKVLNVKLTHLMDFDMEFERPE